MTRKKLSINIEKNNLRTPVGGVHNEAQGVLKTWITGKESENDQVLINKVMLAADLNAGSDLKAEDILRVKQIGRGQHGKVYMGLHKASLKLLALKEVGVTPINTHLCMKELEFLHHSCMVGLEEENGDFLPSFYGSYSDRAAQKIVIVLELLNGGSVSRTVKTGNGVLSEPLLLQAAFCCLTSLKKMHAEGFVHRDVKPDNILINHLLEFKLSDFGLTHKMEKLGEKEKKGPNQVKGSVLYLAPELLQRDAHGCRLGDDSVMNKRDIWSLGMSLMTLALGRHPFFILDPILERIPALCLQQILEEPSPRLCTSGSPVTDSSFALKAGDQVSWLDGNLHSTWSPDFASLLAQMLQKNPKLRPSAQDLLDLDVFDRFKPKGKGKGLADFHNLRALLEKDAERCYPKGIFYGHEEIPAITEAIFDSLEEEKEHFEREQFLHSASMILLRDYENSLQKTRVAPHLRRGETAPNLGPSTNQQFSIQEPLTRLSGLGRTKLSSAKRSNLSEDLHRAVGGNPIKGENNIKEVKRRMSNMLGSNLVPGFVKPSPQTKKLVGFHSKQVSGSPGKEVFWTGRAAPRKNFGSPDRKTSRMSSFADSSFSSVSLGRSTMSSSSSLSSFLKSPVRVRAFSPGDSILGSLCAVDKAKGQNFQPLQPRTSSNLRKARRIRFARDEKEKKKKHGPRAKSLERERHSRKASFGNNSYIELLDFNSSKLTMMKEKSDSGSDLSTSTSESQSHDEENNRSPANKINFGSRNTFIRKGDHTIRIDSLGLENIESMLGHDAAVAFTSKLRFK